MTIPYYDKHSGIRTPESETECVCNRYYVVLDKGTVDKMKADMWDVFDTVKAQCESELRQYLDMFNATHAISPEGDETYVLNFVVQPLPDIGGMIQ